jgi:hypothetical protein
MAPPEFPAAPFVLAAWQRGERSKKETVTVILTIHSPTRIYVGTKIKDLPILKRTCC